MPLGPGKYDDLCTYVREKAQADAALTIILGGNKGNGFSCQAPIHVLVMLEKLLRDTADQIRDSLKKGQV